MKFNIFYIAALLCSIALATAKLHRREPAAGKSSKDLNKGSANDAHVKKQKTSKSAKLCGGESCEKEACFKAIAFGTTTYSCVDKKDLKSHKNLFDDKKHA